MGRDTCRNSFRAEWRLAPQAAAPQPVAFHVTRVDVGNAIGADKMVTAPSGSFKPTDTIYASVSSEGEAPNVTLRRALDVRSWPGGE